MLYYLTPLLLDAYRVVTSQDRVMLLWAFRRALLASMIFLASLTRKVFPPSTGISSNGVGKEEYIQQLACIRTLEWAQPHAW